MSLYWRPRMPSSLPHMWSARHTVPLVCKAHVVCLWCANTATRPVSKTAKLEETQMLEKSHEIGGKHMARKNTKYIYMASVWWHCCGKSDTHILGKNVVKLKEGTHSYYRCCTFGAKLDTDCKMYLVSRTKLTAADDIIATLLILYISLLAHQHRSCIQWILAD